MRIQEHTPLAERRRELLIQPARREDMGAVAELIRSSADWYRPFLDPKDMAEHEVTEAWEEKNFARRDFYLGREGGRTVGTISLQYFGRYAYLGYIYVDADQVGKGYGHRLMRFAESVARHRGMNGMILIAHPKATWAKRAYLKYGFEIIAQDKAEVIAWQGGVLKEYYEEGFELYLFPFETAKGTES